MDDEKTWVVLTNMLTENRPGDLAKVVGHLVATQATQACMFGALQAHLQDAGALDEEGFTKLVTSDVFCETRDALAAQMVGELVALLADTRTGGEER